jgi:hypothetical protein
LCQEDAPLLFVRTYIEGKADMTDRDAVGIPEVAILRQTLLGAA